MPSMQAGKAVKSRRSSGIMQNPRLAVADIKIAVRSQKTAKSIDFMKRAMAECDSVSVDQLSKAALAGNGSAFVII